MFKGTYIFDGVETPNLVSSVFEKEILDTFFKNVRTITSVTIKVGQIAEPFSKQTQLSDIIEASGYTPVTLQLPSMSDWENAVDESLAYSTRTKQLDFSVDGECRFNCYYMVDQDNRLLSVSARLSNTAVKTTDFSGVYKLYQL